MSSSSIVEGEKCSSNVEYQMCLSSDMDEVNLSILVR